MSVTNLDFTRGQEVTHWSVHRRQDNMSFGASALKPVNI